MSYLLTEIALEMLGYKYYDVDGAPGQTNFQNGPRADSAEAVDETLEELLEFAQKQPSQRNKINGNGTQTTMTKTMTPETVSVNTERESVHTNAPPTTHTNAPSTTHANAPPSSHNKGKAASLKLTQRPDEAFLKQLDIEYKRITDQIQRHRLHYTQANIRFAKRIERGSATGQEFLQPFIRQEKENLEKEVQVMCDFRKLVERGIANINPVVVETYHGVFNPNHRSTNANDQ